MEQKKKIILMVAVFGVLLVGAVVMFWLGVFGGSAKNTNVSMPTSPAAPGPTNIAMKSRPNGPPPGMITPGNQGMQHGAAPGGTSSPHGVSPSPVQPSTGGTSARAPMPSAGIMPHNGSSMMSASAMSGISSGSGASHAHAIPSYSDPFSGAPPPPRPSQPNYPRTSKGIIIIPVEVPLYQIPAVNTQTKTGGVKFSPDASAFPVQSNNQYAFDLGRSAGWMVGNNQGKVTAYFQSQDGSVAALNVGSEVSGFRVKAINVDKQYMLLENLQTGAEQQVHLQGGRRSTAR